MSESKALHVKHRPQTFEDVLGQDRIVAQLEKAIAKRKFQTYVFVGPSGCGKTTLARIAAHELGCEATDVQEINAAVYTGVDDMRAVTQTLQYHPIGRQVKALIVDECHMLSKSAWNSLLKVLEEPPEWVYWFLCTTEAMKIPETIKTRCAAFTLKPVDSDTLLTLLERVAKKEKIKVDEDVLSMCVKEANGSPRQALVNLGVCSDVEDMDAAADLLKSAQAGNQAVDLARALIKGSSWSQLVPILQGLKDQNPESIRHVVRAYVTKVALNPSERRAIPCLEILEAFSSVWNQADGLTPVVLACGRLCFSK